MQLQKCKDSLYFCILGIYHKSILFCSVQLFVTQYGNAGKIDTEELKSLRFKSCLFTSTFFSSLFFCFRIGKPRNFLFSILLDQEKYLKHLFPPFGHVQTVIFAKYLTNNMELSGNVCLSIFFFCAHKGVFFFH